MKAKYQGDKLIAILKRRSMTSMELLSTGISTCWWKRVAERLAEHEQLCVVGRRDGVNVYRVVTGTRWKIRSAA